jgi:dTDP-glucose pyrophosphorylase
MIQLVMPMLGKGARYKNSKYKLPKPLIEVMGKPMFLRALESFTNVNPEMKIVLLIREDTNQEFNLEQLIKEFHPKAKVIETKVETKGAAESAALASADLSPEEPLVIVDCDLEFEATDFFNQLSVAFHEGHDGLLVTFHASDPRYSYVYHENQVALRIKEKVPISKSAIIGVYAWKRASDFLSCTKILMDSELNANLREYFISETFEIGIKRGLKFKVIEGKSKSFGTPEELFEFENGVPTN